MPYLKNAERIQIAPDTLTCRVERGGPVLVSFFGGLGLGQVAAPEQVQAMSLRVASLLDIAGTNAAVIQKRAEVKDYIAIDAVLRHGIDMPKLLAAGAVVYGHKFNPMITLKALSYFDDVPALPGEVRTRLARAVENVDATQLPELLTPYAKCPENGVTTMKRSPSTPGLLQVATLCTSRAYTRSTLGRRSQGRDFRSIPAKSSITPIMATTTPRRACTGGIE